MFFERKENTEGIKASFERVKKDIFNLGDEISQIRTEFFELKSIIKSMNEIIDKLRLEILELKANNEPNQEPQFKTPTDIPTDEMKKPTISAIPTDNPTVPVEVGGLKYPNLDISSGNRGVPTDRQTNQQTDNYGEFSSLRPLKQQIHDAHEILDGLDAIKKEIRLKFKQITSQEMMVFSTIYQLEESTPEGVEYRQIAQKLGLSESSIRDYTQKLISKGIPVDKIKLNNKKILLKISQDLKKIASLQALIHLREL